LRIAYEFNEPEWYCQALKTFIYDTGTGVD